MEEEEERSEEEEKEEDEERELEDLPSSGVSRASSDADLLSEPRNILEGLVNPSFSREDSPTGSRSIPSSQWRRPAKSHKVAGPFRDGPHSYSRSLSSSVENMTFTGAPPSQMAGSLPESAREVRDESATTSSTLCLQSNKKKGKAVSAMQSLENIISVCVIYTFIIYYLLITIVAANVFSSTDQACFSFCRMVKVFRFHSVEKQRQVTEQKDSEDKGNQSAHGNVTQNVSLKCTFSQNSTTALNYVSL